MMAEIIGGLWLSTTVLLLSFPNRRLHPTGSTSLGKSSRLMSTPTYIYLPASAVSLGAGWQGSFGVMDHLNPIGFSYVYHITCT